MVTVTVPSPAAIELIDGALGAMVTAAALTVSSQKTEPPKAPKWKPIGRADSSQDDSRKAASSSHESCSRSAVREHNKENARARAGADKASDKGKALLVEKGPV